MALKEGEEREGEKGGREGRERREGREGRGGEGRGEEGGEEVSRMVEGCRWEEDEGTIVEVDQHMHQHMYIRTYMHTYIHTCTYIHWMGLHMQCGKGVGAGCPLTSTRRYVSSKGSIMLFFLASLCL